MANITFKGLDIQTQGNLPHVGDQAPDFVLVTESLETVSLSSFAGKHIVLNIVPSLDTDVCLLSLKTFLSHANDDVVYLTVSRDTPFAVSRVSQREEIEHSFTVSDLSHDFGRDYQCVMVSGPLKDFLSRAVVLIDKSGVVRYTEQVAAVEQEPNYIAALVELEKIQ